MAVNRNRGHAQAEVLGFLLGLGQEAAGIVEPTFQAGQAAQVPLVGRAEVGRADHVLDPPDALGTGVGPQ